jgi:hypothetical protein
MELNIADYLPDSELKDIIIEEIRSQISKDAERILNNAAYHVVFKAVDEALDHQTQEIIQNKVVEIINKLSEFSVFRKADAWSKEDSVAYKELQLAMLANTDLIHQKVKAVIENKNYEEDLRTNSDYFADIILEAIKKGLANA